MRAARFVSEHKTKNIRTTFLRTQPRAKHANIFVCKLKYCKSILRSNQFFLLTKKTQVCYTTRMAFESSATRRRPKQFDELVGQDFVASTLKNSLLSKNIAHAYLFSGPRGCGKTSTARILAKALNCETGPTANPCGVCAHCKEITSGASLDVIEIDGASNTSVDNIRQIKDEVLFPPNSSRYKIYIIDEVHMLSTNAFNALLKTIEEPPPYVIFIFATTELQKVPATIKSRCQQFNFRLVSIETIAHLLRDACNEMKITSDDESLFWIAKESTGSVRDAYTLFDQVSSMCNGEILFNKIKDKLGIVSLDHLNALFEFCATGKTFDALQMLDEFLQQGNSIEQITSNATQYARSLLLIKNGVEKESIIGNDKKRFSEIVLSAWNKTQTERALSIFLHLYRDLRFSLAPRSELELAFSRLCSLKNFVSNDEIKTTLSRAENLLLKNVNLTSSNETSTNTSSVNQSFENANALIEPNFNLTERFREADKVQAENENTNASFVNQSSANENVNTNQSSTNENASFVNQSSTNGNSNASFTNQSSTNENASFTNQRSANVNASFTNQSSTNGNANASFTNQSSISASANFVNQSSTNGNSNASFTNQSSTNTSSVNQSFENANASIEPNFNLTERFCEADKVQVENENTNASFVNQSSINENASFVNQSSISADELKSKIIEAFSNDGSMTASIVSSTRNWKIENNCVKLEAKNEYQKNYFDSHATFFSETIKKNFGLHVSFEVSLAQNAHENRSVQKFPLQVDIVQKVFKGSVVQ